MFAICYNRYQCVSDLFRTTHSLVIGERWLCDVHIDRVVCSEIETLVWRQNVVPIAISYCVLIPKYAVAVAIFLLIRNR